MAVHWIGLDTARVKPILLSAKLYKAYYKNKKITNYFVLYNFIPFQRVSFYPYILKGGHTIPVSIGADST